jgi:hypothetical protein
LGERERQDERRQAVRLNMGLGFGDLSAATENSFFINGKIRKLGSVSFDYSDKDFMRPWRFSDDAGRLQLTLIRRLTEKPNRIC